MPHRLPSLLFLALLLFLNFVVASPPLFGRDEQGAGDSLWELELNDVFGAAAAGLYKLWDFSTAPGGDPTIPSELPSELQPPDERQYLPQPQPPENPGPMAFPLLLDPPPIMKTCAEAGKNPENQLDRLEVEQSWWQVEQEPETGYVATSLPPLIPQPHTLLTQKKKKDCGAMIGSFTVKRYHKTTGEKNEER